MHKCSCRAQTRFRLRGLSIQRKCCTPPVKIRPFAANATTNPTAAAFTLLKVGVTRKMKNNAYRYQYGAVGWKNNVSPRPPIWSLTLLENTFFSTHVAVVKVAYGTPSASTFFRYISIPTAYTVYLAVLLIQISTTNEEQRHVEVINRCVEPLI